MDTERNDWCATSNSGGSFNSKACLSSAETEDVEQVRNSGTPTILMLFLRKLASQPSHLICTVSAIAVRCLTSFCRYRMSSTHVDRLSSMPDTLTLIVDSSEVVDSLYSFGSDLATLMSDLMIAILLSETARSSTFKASAMSLRRDVRSSLLKDSSYNADAPAAWSASPAGKNERKGGGGQNRCCRPRCQQRHLSSLGRFARHFSKFTLYSTPPDLISTEFYVLKCAESSTLKKILCCAQQQTVYSIACSITSPSHSFNDN